MKMFNIEWNYILQNNKVMINMKKIQNMMICIFQLQNSTSQLQFAYFDNNCIFFTLIPLFVPPQSLFFIFPLLFPKQPNVQIGYKCGKYNLMASQAYICIPTSAQSKNFYRNSNKQIANIQLKMQSQGWVAFPNYFSLIPYSQNNPTTLYQPVPQFYPLMYDFSGYEFKFIQLQNISQPSIEQPLNQNQQNQTFSISQEPVSDIQLKIEQNCKDKDRNIVSNSLKVFRKFASDSAKLEGSIVQEIIKANNLKYSIEQFLKDLQKKIPRERNYFGIKFLKSLLSKKEKTNFMVMIRTLLNYYYRKQVYTTVLTSWKILNPAKKKQIAGTRKIRHIL